MRSSVDAFNEEVEAELERVAEVVAGPHDVLGHQLDQVGIFVERHAGGDLVGDLSQAFATVARKGGLFEGKTVDEAVEDGVGVGSELHGQAPVAQASQHGFVMAEVGRPGESRDSMSGAAHR